MSGIYRDKTSDPPHSSPILKRNMQLTVPKGAIIFLPDWIGRLRTAIFFGQISWVARVPQAKTAHQIARTR